MTESESPRRVRITRTMLGRLAAVGLFLCLGTLAVMHTVTNRSSGDSKTENSEAPAETDAAAPDVTAATGAHSDAAIANPVTPTKQATHATIPQLTNTSSNALMASSSPSNSKPLAAPPMTSGFPINSPQSKSAPNNSILNAANRSDGSNSPPTTNASSTLRPPPAMSFSDSSPKTQSPASSQLGGDPPIVSAQIQVESDEGTHGDPTSPSALPSAAARNTGLQDNAPRAFGSPSIGSNPQTSSGNPMRPLAGSTSSNASVPPITSGTTRLTDTATTYDPVDNASSTRSMPQSTNDNSKLSDKNPLQFAGNSGAANSFGSNPGSSPRPETTALGTSGKPNSILPTNSSTGNTPVRSAIPTTSNPTASFGSNSETSQDAFASSSRSYESANRPPADSLRVQSTPGAANLEGPQTPMLKLQKIAPREVQINKPAEMQLVVQNAGQVPAEQVIVHDRIPDGTELIDATPKANQSNDGTLSWNLGTIAPGETSKIVINLMPRQPGEFGSVAQVTFAAQASARTLCTQPILGVTMTTKPKVLIGDDVLLDIVVENKGDGPATNVLLQEDVPELLAYEDGSRELEFEIGTLAPGQKRSVQLRLKAAKVGTTQNRIVAQGDAGLEISDMVEVEIVSPELQATGDGPARKYLNRQATHEFAVSNAGTAPANNVDFVARLPRGLKFVSANNHGQFDSSSNSVYWSLQQLTTGQVGRVELVTVPIEPGDQKIEFEATADLNQKAAVSKSLFVEYLVELFCEIDDLTDPIEIGSETAYRIKVTNQGLQPATNIRLNVDFPAGIEPIGVSGSIPHQIQGQRVVFSPLDRLDAQQETVVTITAKGTVEGDHRVVVSMASDARETQIAKEESTQVYSDQR